MSTIWAITIALQWILLLLLALVTAGVLRYLGRVDALLSARNPPTTKYELGDRVDEFELYDSTGGTLTTQDLLQGRDIVVLLFVTATCPACEIVLRQVEDLATRRPVPASSSWSICVSIAGYSHGDQVERVQAKHPKLLSEGVRTLLDRDGTASNQCGITGVPTGIAIDEEGRVVSKSANPHAGWLYELLGVAEPEKSMLSIPDGVVPIMAAHGG